MALYRVPITEIAERFVTVEAGSADTAAYWAKDRRNWLDSSDPQHYTEPGPPVRLEDDATDCMTAYKDRIEGSTT